MPKPWPGRAKLPQPAAGLSCFCCSRRRPTRVRKVSVAGLGCGRAGARTGPAACELHKVSPGPGSRRGAGAVVGVRTTDSDITDSDKDH